MSETKEHVPESYICPITHAIMKDPWVDTDGNSFEKEAIMEWYGINRVSPITRNPMDASKLVPNRSLKALIEEYVRTHGITLANSASTSVFNIPQVAAAPLNRKPIILFAVIDNSGSMGESCGSNGTGEDDGYSRLDLVKHTLNTIITSLSEHDKICIIKFSTVAEVFAQLTVCSKANQRLLIDSLQHLEPENQTNIWDGVRLAVDMISGVMENPASAQASIEIYLLTDGEPTINPPGPIVTTIQSCLRRKCPTRTPIINTFGYGYRLDSKMLYDIAKCGNGIFGFLPDSTMVGTVFINALSQSLVGSGQEAARAAAVAEAGEQSLHQDLMGQFIFRLTDLLDALLDGTHSGEPKRPQILEFTTYAKELLESLPQEQDLAAFRAFVKDVLVDCSDNTDPSLGQIMKASEPDFFAKWGKHYLYSVLSAYQQRVCVNFKDRGVQHFAFPAFKEEQARIEEVFVEIAPPKPSRKQPAHYGGYGRAMAGGHAAGAAAAAPASPVAMNRYYNAAGGCYGADSLILTGTEGLSSARKAADLHKGMAVLSNKGMTTIECVVKLRYSGTLHTVGGLVHLTPYHPVMIGNGAHFPCELPAKNLNIQTSSTAADASVPSPARRINGVEGGKSFVGHVYDFVLANRGTLACPYLLASTSSAAPEEFRVLYAATFGHDCRTGKFAHEYFGSEAVVNDLKAHNSVGYAAGYVELNEYQYVRNSKTNLVSHMAVEGRSATI